MVFSPREARKEEHGPEASATPERSAASLAPSEIQDVEKGVELKGVAVITETAQPKPSWLPLSPLLSRTSKGRARCFPEPPKPS